MISTYDNFIAVDWAMSNMAISRLTKHGEIQTKDVPSSVNDLRVYLKNLKGTKILTIEETTTSQWLYTELRDCVNEMIICDPYRNWLLKEGPKTDKIDSQKLAQLLRAGLLKPVYHSGEDFIYLRKLVSSYQDIIKTGVAYKNRRAALFRAYGKSKKSKEVESELDQFILKKYDENILFYEEQRKEFKEEFKKVHKKYPLIRKLQTLPGIGLIGAVKTAAIVVNAKRFQEKGDFLSYCGLVRLEKISGGRSYGSKKPRHCRVLKSVFKTAALAVIAGKSPDSKWRAYYLELIKNGRSEQQARNAIARRIAVLAYGIMKTGKNYKAKEDITEIKN